MTKASGAQGQGGEGLVDEALAEIGREARADEACSICHASVRPERRDRHMDWHASLLRHVERERLPEVYGGAAIAADLAASGPSREGEACGRGCPAWGISPVAAVMSATKHDHTRLAAARPYENPAASGPSREGEGALTEDERESLDTALNPLGDPRGEFLADRVYDAVEDILAARLAAARPVPAPDATAAVVALIDEWDDWCRTRCRACYDAEFRKTHSHDCGITRRDVVDALRAVLGLTP